MSNLAEVKKQAAAVSVGTVQDFLVKNKTRIANALAKKMSYEEFCSLFMLTIRENKQLANCTQESFIAAAVQTVQLGLRPGPIAHCYYVPRKIKGVRQVQFILGYRGYCELINRSGKATILTADVVREGDQINVQHGLNPVLDHVYAPSGSRGAIVGAYCIAKNLLADEKVFIYLDRDELDKARAASDSKDSEYSPWNKWEEAMCAKTAVRRISKLLPLSIETQRKIAVDESVKVDVRQDMTQVPDSMEWEDATPAEMVEEAPAQAPAEPQEAPVEEDYVPPGEELPPDGWEEAREATQEAVSQANTAPSQAPPPQSAPPQEKPPQKPKNAISEKQHKRLWGIAHSSGWTSDEVKAYLLEAHNVQHSDHVTWGKQYDEICEYIEKHPRP